LDTSQEGKDGEFHGISLPNDSSLELYSLLKTACKKTLPRPKLINSYETELIDFSEICKKAIIEAHINRQKVPSLVKGLFIFLAAGTVMPTSYFLQHKYNLFTHHSLLFFAVLITELICCKFTYQIVVNCYRPTWQDEGKTEAKKR